jgi:hypothetical protein
MILAALTTLSAADSEITTLVGLEKAANLIELDLGGNQIADLSPLMGLPNLQVLDLSQNKISDLNPLLTLPSLVSLEIQYNSFDISDNSGSVAILEQLAASGVDVVYKTTYDDWRNAYFDGQDLIDPNKESTLWGHRANPDGDSLPNLVEFFMGLDPNEATAGNAFAISNDSDNITFTYRRAKDVVPSTGGPEYSLDLINWTSIGILEEQIDDRGTYVIIEATMPVNPDDQTIFVRLSVGDGN